MKTLLTVIFLSGLLFALQGWAEDANYNSTTRIISFPRVTIDSNDAYTDAQLKLNLDGSYEVLVLEPELEPNLTGDWGGTLYGLSTPYFSPPYPCGSMVTNISFIQNDNKLIGLGDFSGNNCINGVVDIVGEIDGRNLTFTVIFSSGDKINFNGSISTDNNLVGVGNFEGIPPADGPWTLSLQDKP